MAIVTGAVTLDGNPVADAGVVFQPALGPIATARTDANGNYRLVTANQDGALVGEHDITVAKVPLVVYETVGPGTMGAPVSVSRPRGNFPTRYSRRETSGLHAVVQSGIENVVPIVLTTKEK